MKHEAILFTQDTCSPLLCVCVRACVCLCVCVCVCVPPRITLLLCGPSPIADTALIYTTYDAKVTRLRSVTLSVVAVIAPCQEQCYIYQLSHL